MDERLLVLSAKKTLSVPLYVVRDETDYDYDWDYDSFVILILLVILIRRPRTRSAWTGGKRCRATLVTALQG